MVMIRSWKPREVVFWVVRAWESVQAGSAGVQGVADKAGVSHAGGGSCLVGVELDADGMCLVCDVSGFHGVEHVLPSALGEGEPGLDLPCPSCTDNRAMRTSLPGRFRRQARAG